MKVPHMLIINLACTDGTCMTSHCTTVRPSVSSFYLFLLMMKRFSARAFVLIKFVEDSLFRVASHSFRNFFPMNDWRSCAAAAVFGTLCVFCRPTSPPQREFSVARSLARWHDTSTWPGNGLSRLPVNLEWRAECACASNDRQKMRRNISYAVSLRLIMLFVFITKL